MSCTESDFEKISWHDCHIWGIAFQSGAPEKDDWTSDLAFDIDFICQWPCENNGYRFRVAPALLLFHGVFEARIGINWGESSSLHELSIAVVQREPVPEERACVSIDKPNYRWTIELNWPEGEIAFIGSGFTQTLRTEPVLMQEQSFTFAARSALLSMR